MIIKENRIVVESNCDNIIKEITIPIIAKMGNLYNLTEKMIVVKMEDFLTLIISKRN